ncbi:phage antirepressor N-terminal domain-containing protein [Rhodoferax sp. 4810]|uniref:Phage antirepressor N-terminal domain-containing protein n=1 Tax=Thiospirillum jenense TaxID=1653858 RepID=A0A839HCT1_9GAMM|nr:phage antirepressor N-terminal domain-containing protein [Thiospirillum jenense]MBB1078118.1 phage antirepressor N-terminal domain-containing protein [Rhodoferax jenense]MBB1125950.1 phage antirepressor N-terminal domain-containing protein [Thiospirillum jenense]
MSSLIPVPFRATTLFLIDVDGTPYVPMKPVVEGMGLDWAGQFTKLKENQRFTACIEEISMQLPSDIQRRSVCCLALRKLPGWLMTIYPNKVKPEIRDNIIAYQNECDDVLWEYWSKGHATNPRTEQTPEPPSTPTMTNYEYAANLVLVFIRAAKAFGLRGNQARLSANRAIRHFTGVNLLEAMGHIYLEAPDQEVLLAVSDLALRLNCTVHSVNPKITNAGLQTEQRDHKDKLYYELTALGHRFGVYLDTNKKHSDGTPIRQIKWRASVIECLQNSER